MSKALYKTFISVSSATLFSSTNCTAESCVHLLVLSDPHLSKEQDASGGEMQSVAVHLITRSPAPQEGPKRPYEDRVSNRIVLEIIVDRANPIVRLIKITQVRLNLTYLKNMYIRHNRKNLFNQQLKLSTNYWWQARAAADIVCTNMKQNKGSVSH